MRIAKRARAVLLGSLPASLGTTLTVAFVLVAVFADMLAPHDPFSFAGRSFEPPLGDYLLGTDNLGRDLLSGVIYGARTSLIVGLCVAVASLVIGTLIGGLAGFLGGWVDDVLMRFTELVQVMPRFFMALAVVALFGPSLTNLVAILALTSWELTARVARSSVLSIRERGFVVAAEVLGSSRFRNLAVHVIPNVFAPVVALASLQVGGAILIEAGLSFLGLGDPNVISWGYMLNNAQAFVRTAWWMSVFPGVAVALATLGVNLLGDTLTESSAPRLRAVSEAAS